MTNQEFDQVKSYSSLLVAELHQAIFHEQVYNRLKSVLRLAEELEVHIMVMEKQRKKGTSNIVRLKIA